MTKPLSIAAIIFIILIGASIAGAQPACCPALDKGTDLWAELSPDQQKQVSQLRAEYLKKLEAIRSEVGKKRIELFEQSSKDKVDDQAVEKIREDMWNLQDQARKENRAFGTKFRTLLTPEQKEKFGTTGLGMGFGRQGMGGGACCAIGGNQGAACCGVDGGKGNRMGCRMMGGKGGCCGAGPNM